MNVQKTTFNVLFYLKKKSDGKASKIAKNALTPIMGRITVNGKPKGFSPKCKIPANMWSQSTQKVIGNSEEARCINKVLKLYRDKAESHYNSLFEQNDGKVTVEEVIAYLFGKFSRTKNLIEFFDEYIQEILEPRVKIGDLTETTKERYVTTKDRLKAFLENKFNVSDIRLENIYPQFVLKFYLFIRENYKCEHNGASKYIQKLRTIILSAIGNGLMSHDPFVNYEFNWEKFDRGFLIEEEIERIMQKVFTIPRLERIRDIFLFACFTGLAYKEVKNLTKDKIVKLFDENFWIRVERSKTKTEERVPLLEIPMVLIAKYANEMKDSPYVFPVISNQKTNAYLKEIGDICGVNKNMTFHLARHTFATTVTLNNGVPIEALSKMLGHTNLKTTQIYARVLNSFVGEAFEALRPHLKLLEQKYLKAS